MKRLFWPLQRLNASIYSFLLCLCFAQGAAAQVSLNLAEAQATYTLEIAKQIEWPKGSNHTSIRIGILGTDSRLLKAFQDREAIRIKGLQQKAEFIDDLNSDLNRYAIIFVTHNHRAKNNEVFNTTRHSLIIVDGKVSQEAMMLSLQTEGNRLKLKFNRENLAERGFKISASLIDFAGTREDLSEELKAREENLKKLLEQVKVKEKELESLSLKLSAEAKKLVEAESKLKEAENTIKNYQAEARELKGVILASKNEIAKNEEITSRQKQLVESIKAEMSEKELQVNRLGKSIEANKNILREQVSKIEKQNQEIATRDETITEQRSWLKANIFIIMIFAVFIFVLWKTNALRQKANNKLKKLNKKLYELATTDGLTGLFNRRHFLESAENELQRSQRNDFNCTLMMVDIDHFKRVNDSYGHPAGDQVIVRVAELLSESMRQYDILGRLGGEEFSMMLMDCDIVQAKEIAERLCSKVSNEPIYYSKNKIVVSVSIGLSQLDSSDTDIDQVFLRADRALYQAKEQGRNQVVLYQS